MLCCGGGKSKSKTKLTCEVVLLDGSFITFSKSQNIKPNTKVETLIKLVCEHLHLKENKYFGLKAKSNLAKKQNWLDPAKSLSSEVHLSETSPNKMVFLEFGVRFYAEQPGHLADEVTRYLFFLQLKRDVLSGKLVCPWKLATQLSALALQSELGDYCLSEHKRGYVSEFRFVPHQDESFEKEVARLHAQYSGLTPAGAEVKYLKKCKQVDLYGVDLIGCKFRDSPNTTEYQIGLSPRGIETFRNKRRVSIFYWPQVLVVKSKNAQLQVDVMSKNGQSATHTFHCDHDVTSVCNVIRSHLHFHAMTSRYESKDSDDQYEVVRLSSKRYPPRVQQNHNENVAVNLQPDVYKLEAENKSVPENKENVNTYQVNDNGSMFNASRYMTPTSERKQRHHRHKQALSDNESHQRSRNRSRGRSSGEESDSPSKRRIRARRNRQYRDHNTTRRRPNQYFTDSEMINRIDTQITNKKSYRHHKPNNKRSSYTSELAKQQLWEHIRKEQTQMEGFANQFDIPYTEVKTRGNPHKQVKRRPSYRKSSDILGSKPRINGYTDDDDGLLEPLQVTTTQTAHKNRQNYQPNQYHVRHRTKSNHKLDWDTKSGHISDYSVSSSVSRKSRHNRRKSDHIIYTQI